MRRALDGSPVITTTHGQPGYGYFNKHAGYDYGIVKWAVRAPEAGVITAVYANRPTADGGNIVELKGAYTHRFLHLDSIQVAVGQQVTEGQQLAITGNTGNVAYHLHHDVRKNGTAWTDSYANYYDWELIIKGANMALTDLGQARVLAYGLGGRDGFDGRQNALAGESDTDLNKAHVGKDPSKEIWDWYNSPEGVNSRNAKNAVYAERNTLRTRVNELTADRDGLIVKYDARGAEITTLTSQVAQKDAELIATTAQNVTLTAENEALKKQLSAGGDTTALSGWELIRLGINKLLSGGK